MIKGTIDRFEGEYAIVELAYEEIYFIEILCSNFKIFPSQGDIIMIQSINNVCISDEYGFISHKVKKMLNMLQKPIECLILIDQNQTNETNARIEELALDLFED